MTREQMKTDLRAIADGMVTLLLTFAYDLWLLACHMFNRLKA